MPFPLYSADAITHTAMFWFSSTTPAPALPKSESSDLKEITLELPPTAPATPEGSDEDSDEGNNEGSNEDSYEDIDAAPITSTQTDATSMIMCTLIEGCEKCAGHKRKCMTKKVGDANRVQMKERFSSLVVEHRYDEEGYARWTLTSPRSGNAFNKLNDAEDYVVARDIFAEDAEKVKVKKNLKKKGALKVVRRSFGKSFNCFFELFN